MKTLIFFLPLLLVSCSSNKKGTKATLLEVPEVTESKSFHKAVPNNAIKSTEKPFKSKEKETQTNEAIIPDIPSKNITVPWYIGEKMEYQISAIGLDAASFSIEIPKALFHKNTKVWNIVAKGQTKGFTKRIYYFNMICESFLGQNLQPLYFQSSTIEGKDTKQSIEKFNPKEGTYSVLKKRNNLVEKNKEISFDFPDVYADPISFFYILRVVDVGDSFKLLSNQKVKDIFIKKIDSDIVVIGKRKYEADKLTILYDGKEQLIWRESFDKKRILKAKIHMSFASGTVLLYE